MKDYSESDKKIILKDYRGLLRASKKFRTTPEDTAYIRKAFNYAAEAHMTMRRKSGEPYITHPIAVARICTEEIGLGATSIACALLHDTVEDTDVTLEDIELIFGRREKRIIDGLTKISGAFDLSTSDQAENFRKMILTLPDDVRVIFIKLADRLHNMRTLGSMRPDKQRKIASETLFLYAPLAHRLGLNAVKTELEDLSLKHTEPEAYNEIATKLRKSQEIRARFISQFISPLKKELDKTGLKYSIKGRPKSIYSIYNKIKKKKVTFEEIYDLFAVRIILDSKQENEKTDAWRVYSVVTDFYRPNPDRLRDWITNPRSNGYESLHTTVMSPTGKWVEIQIRSERMDEIAEKGMAAHWKYKDSKKKIESKFDNWINKIRDLVENKETDTLDFIDDFKLNLYAEEMYIFTPKGELRTLPKNATALDFAFDIHGDIGKKCIGAKVNHKLVPLNHILSSGDQVEIITSNKQKPKEAWLDFVVTSKARSNVKQSLKEEVKQVAEQGKESLKRKLKSLKVDYNDKNISELLKLYDFKNPLDLNFQIANGKIDLSKIKSIVVKGGILKYEKESVLTSLFRRKQKEAKKLDQGEIISSFGGKSSEAIILGDDSLKQVDYKIAKCCSPIPGDNVFGFLTINEGIKIHRTNCPNAVQLMSHYAYRVLKAKWKSQTLKEFSVGVEFTGIDGMGILNSLTNLVTGSLNINIKSLNIGSEAGFFNGNLNALVHDTKHLDDLMKEMKKIEGIKTVERVY
ncbi:RelA/SpoT family protein [Flavobacteriales bacterium]|nr:RelA/SpoT family protein [Flavobacteriales bacterium]|tara:strand:+ start:2500 stop:4737 length:2238 start_codon:yes stop_codon:yes gene_type:complete